MYVFQELYIYIYLLLPLFHDGINMRYYCRDFYVYISLKIAHLIAKRKTQCLIRKQRKLRRRNQSRLGEKKMSLSVNCKQNEISSECMVWLDCNYKNRKYLCYEYNQEKRSRTPTFILRKMVKLTEQNQLKHRERKKKLQICCIRQKKPKT